MVEVSLDDEKMTLVVRGMHKLWALKSAMIIPIEQIAGARINHQEVKQPEGWRVAGTRIPGLITAGTYKALGDKVFWDVVNLDKSIIIDLQHSEYKQLILEVNDPGAVVDEINSKVTATRESH